MGNTVLNRYVLAKLTIGGDECNWYSYRSETDGQRWEPSCRLSHCNVEEDGCFKTFEICYTFMGLITYFMFCCGLDCSQDIKIHLVFSVCTTRPFSLLVTNNNSSLITRCTCSARNLQKMSALVMTHLLHNYNMMAAPQLT